MPPVAKPLPHVTSIHGHQLVDEYAWLRNRNAREVIAYLEAENAYTETVTRPSVPLREALFREMRARVAEPDATVPAERDGFAYYYRTDPDWQYPIYCRRRRRPGAEEQVLLDLNALARGHGFLHARALRVSPDHRFLAYSIDTTGSEIYTLCVKDLDTGELLADRIANTSGDIEWANDSRTLFYVDLDPTMRPDRLCRHRLGEIGPDPVLYHEPDARFLVELGKSKSRKYVFVMISSAITSEVWYLDADAPLSEPDLFARRTQGIAFSVEHHEDSFFVLTNHEAVNFRVMQAEITGSSPGSWREVVAHRDDVTLEDMEVYRNHLVLYCRVDGRRSVRVLSLRTGEEHELAFDAPACVVASGDNPDFDSSRVRLVFSSMITPQTVFDYDMDSRTRTVRKVHELGGGYDANDYRIERIHARASDGTQVPITIAYRKGLALDGSNPCLLVGYGAYGVNEEPSFEAHRISLLDRGFVCAIAHVRGGGERGRTWHLAGRMMQKKNSFTDFIAAAEHLIACGYTSRAKLAIYGKSAGGLLIGAVLNMRPELVAAAIADVPFVDVVNTMLDVSMPLAANELEEWGDPHDPDYFEYIRSYSPYENVSGRAYPPLLIRAALNDARVRYWEPAKWTARLRARKSDPNPLLLATDMNASHGGASGRYDELRTTAFDYAFLLTQLGMLAPHAVN